MTLKKSFFLFSGVLGMFLVAIFACNPSASSTDPEGETGEGPTLALTPEIPRWITSQSPEDLDQSDFDNFAWSLFIALNWPVEAGGTTADSGTQIGAGAGDGLAVWETWTDKTTMYADTVAGPPPFGERIIPSTVCQNMNGTGRLFQKISHGADNPEIEDFSQAFTFPLIDQEGNPVRFEVTYNQPVYDYITNNNLYSFSGQQQYYANQVAAGHAHEDTVTYFSGQKFVKDVVKLDFPAFTAAGQDGAIATKASWKLKGPNDDITKFHMAEALVYFGDEDSCAMDTLLLVGLHIIAKLENQHNWIWSTFEHEDNVPPLDSTTGKAMPVAGKTYTFYDASGSVPDSLEPVMYSVDFPTTSSPAPGQAPTQVARIFPKVSTISTDSATVIPPKVTQYWNQTIPQSLNSEVHDLFKQVNPNSIWQHYNLIGTQWFNTADTQIDPFQVQSLSYLEEVPKHNKNFLNEELRSHMIPNNLSNSTMETYLMWRSSCMWCHGASSNLTLSDLDSFSLGGGNGMLRYDLIYTISTPAIAAKASKK